MKENTFDIPAYKFFVMKINDGRAAHSLVSYNDYIKDLDKFSDLIKIPFENIDGLTIAEVRDLLNQTDLLLACATTYQIDKDWQRFDIIKTIYIDLDYDDIKKETIDKAIEKWMMLFYNENDEITRKVYRCFFERYQDGSYEKTKERIKKLEIGK